MHRQNGYLPCPKKGATNNGNDPMDMGINRPGKDKEADGDQRTANNRCPMLALDTATIEH